jgi:uncharacterized membrane protein YfcA
MLRQLLIVLSGLVVGVLSGVMGVGGGILLVPIMVLGFAVPQHVAQGTSLAAIVPTSVVGALTHYRRGNLVVPAALLMSAGGVLGVAVGAGVALNLPRDLLGRVFGAFLLFAAFRTWPRRDEPVLPAAPT